VADSKLNKHKILTDKIITEQAIELHRFHMVMGDFMVNGVSNYHAEEEPSELIDLLIRQRNFGVLGKLIEGEMLMDDFEIIQGYSLLEELYLNNRHFGIFNSVNPVIKTIMLAAKARLEIVISDGVNFEDLYELNSEMFQTIGKIEINELAAVADMSLQSVRNQISQGKTHFKAQPMDGKFYVDVDEAKLWLKQRNSFKPTINFNEVSIRERKEGLLLVPVAKDGSYFNSDCRMTKGYQVGDKGSEVYCNDFKSARNLLMMMPLAKWRRPNSSNNFGIVSASEWMFIPKDRVLGN
jgi:hypothetical protein